MTPSPDRLKTNMHLTEKYFERRPRHTVKSDRLRRFGRRHVSQIWCFSACAARILFLYRNVGPDPPRGSPINALPADSPSSSEGQSTAGLILKISFAFVAQI